MHTKDARALGETEQRLYLVSAWREAPVFSRRQRAALAWCEAVTVLPQGGIPDALYQEVAEAFEDTEQLTLTLAVIEINGWNRLSVAFRPLVAHYRSARGRESRAGSGRDGSPIG